MATINKINLVLEWSKKVPSFDTKFILSLKRQYDKNSRITSKQEIALDNIISSWKIGEKKYNREIKRDNARDKYQIKNVLLKKLEVSIGRRPRIDVDYHFGRYLIYVKQLESKCFKKFRVLIDLILFMKNTVEVFGIDKDDDDREKEIKGLICKYNRKRIFYTDIIGGEITRRNLIHTPKEIKNIDYLHLLDMNNSLKNIIKSYNGVELSYLNELKKSTEKIKTVLDKYHFGKKSHLRGGFHRNRHPITKKNTWRIRGFEDGGYHTSEDDSDEIISYLKTSDDEFEEISYDDEDDDENECNSSFHGYNGHTCNER